MEVELRHLRAFVAVATSRSFTRAAEQLFITQPALTRTIRQLESMLGADLVDRNTHPVSLTQAGEEFLPYASRILAHLEAGVSIVRKQAGVRLGFAWLLPDPWAQHVVSGFEEATGNSVALVRTDDPLAAIEEGRVDVALVRGSIPDTRAVRIVHLFDEARVAVCSVNSGLARLDALDWNDVSDWTLVVTPSAAPPGRGRGRQAPDRGASWKRPTSMSGSSRSPPTVASASSPTSPRGAAFTRRCASSRCVTPRQARCRSRSAPVCASRCSGASSRRRSPRSNSARTGPRPTARYPALSTARPARTAACDAASPGVKALSPPAARPAGPGTAAHRAG
ncbi:MAG TPA: LysR family transcriptional regulator [Trebonia sp.]